MNTKTYVKLREKERKKARRSWADGKSGQSLRDDEVAHRPLRFSHGLINPTALRRTGPWTPIAVENSRAKPWVPYAQRRSQHSLARITDPWRADGGFILRTRRDDRRVRRNPRSRLPEGRVYQGIEGRMHRQGRQGRRRFTAVRVLVLRNGNVLATTRAGVAVGAVVIRRVPTKRRTGRAAGVGEDGDGSSSGVVGARGTGSVLSARIDGLNDGLGVWPIVWFDSGRNPCGCRGQDGGRECNGAQICALGNSSILEHNQQASVIPPLDLEATILAVIVRKCCLNIFGLQLLGKTCKIKDTGH